MKILFLAKKNKPFSRNAAELIKLHIDENTIVFGELNDPFPSKLLIERFDYLLSYVSPWIVPKELLSNISKASINFHPGPPEYPGIGCTNFAIYNRERDFGITVHHMEEGVDSGSIITVERFPLLPNDSVYSLTQRCYVYIYVAFVKIFHLIISGSVLPESEESWKRKPYTRKELNSLCAITKDMPANEVIRRIKATTYPNMPGAFIEMFGYKFVFSEEDR